MKVHFTYENLPDSFNDFMLKEGEYWDLIPGIGFVEIEINTIGDIYKLLEKFDKETNQKTEIALSILDKADDADDEEMMIAIVKPATKIF